MIRLATDGQMKTKGMQMASIRVRIVLLTILAAVAAWPACTPVRSAFAGPFEDGYVAYERGDYVTGMRLLRPLAERGDARAQTLMGYMYKEGSGVSPDHIEATNWFRRAANQGDGLAQIHLADLYRRGVGVLKDSIEAYVWAGLAAINPNSHAQDRERAAQYRDGYSRFLSPAEIEAAQKRIREWKPKPE